MTKPVDRDQLIVKIESIFGQSLAGRRALVVDDDAQARDILSRTLTQCGLDVEEAENGAIAFGKVSEGYDLVILDLSMPVMDGFEFLARLDDLGLSKKPEIIVFSAMHLDETMRARLEGFGPLLLNACLYVLEPGSAQPASFVDSLFQGSSLTYLSGAVAVR